jgi:hypothetical protein
MFVMLTKQSVETAGRHLEDLDYLFANDSPFVWNAERDFAAIKSAEAAADSKAAVVISDEAEKSG